MFQHKSLLLSYVKRYNSLDMSSILKKQIFLFAELNDFFISPAKREKIDSYRLTTSINTIHKHEIYSLTHTHAIAQFNERLFFSRETKFKDLNVYVL